MSHTIFRTSQDLTALHFDAVHSNLAGFIAKQPAEGRAAQSLRDERKPGTLLPFLSLLLGIAVSADVGHAS
jgi:hypothetical protein